MTRLVKHRQVKKMWQVRLTCTEQNTRKTKEFMIKRIRKKSCIRETKHSSMVDYTYLLIFNTYGFIKDLIMDICVNAATHHTRFPRFRKCKYLLSKILAQLF